MGPIASSTHRLVLPAADSYRHSMDKELQRSKFQGNTFNSPVLRIKQNNKKKEENNNPTPPPREGVFNFKYLF